MIDDADIEKYLNVLKKTKPDAKSIPPIQPTAPAAPAQQHKSSVYVDPTCDIRGIERMKFGRDIIIQKDCWLNIAYENPTPGPMIIIEDGVNIGRRCTVSAANKIHIGRYVLFAPNVFIADTHHEYQNIEIPIMHQGITTAHDQVIIGEGSWIGINAVIMGNVTVGRHCVIGANSVVTRPIPDFCIAAGNPVEIIKVFDVRTKKWVRVRSKSEVDEYLAARGDHPSETVHNNS